MKETLKEVLDNQKKLPENQQLILEAVGTHGKTLKELTKETKKLRKTRASKESVKEMRVEVEKMNATDNLPLALLFHEYPPVAQTDME